MNAKIPVFVVCVEVIIYLLLYNPDDCTFKFNTFFTLYIVKLLNIYVLIQFNKKMLVVVQKI